MTWQILTDQHDLAVLTYQHDLAVLTDQHDLAVLKVTDTSQQIVTVMSISMT